MKKYNNYQQAERDLLFQIIRNPQFITKTTNEILQTGFILTNPLSNRNDHSNYEYAEEFFKWLISGNTDLTDKLVSINPWVQRFVDTTGLPEGFSSSYGKRIKEQLRPIVMEIKEFVDSRRGYINILQPQDQVILTVKTTHEFPCTIGIQFFIRYNRLHMIVNMRSNNCYSVMPYDVYNFTMLQAFVATELNMMIGWYYHSINSAHVYRGDVRRLQPLHTRVRKNKERLLKIEADMEIGRRIIYFTCKEFKMRNTDEIKQVKRDEEIVVPRHVARYIIRTETELSFKQISDLFGAQTDHTTIMNSLVKVQELIHTDESIQHKINSIIKNVYNNESARTTETL